MRAKEHARLRDRFEDALDFLDALPTMVEFAGETGTVHYMVEPEDVLRTEDGYLLTGAALMIQLAFQRSEYRSEFIPNSVRDELILYIDARVG